MDRIDRLYTKAQQRTLPLSVGLFFRWQGCKEVFPLGGWTAENIRLAKAAGIKAGLKTDERTDI